MPYTPKQLRYFAAAEKQGKPVPKDWKDYARKPQRKTRGKRKR